MSDNRSFSPSAMSSPTAHNVQFDLEAGQSPIATGHLRPPSIRSDPEPESSNGLPAPILKRRGTRSATVTSFKTVDNSPLRPNWHPGQEPGLDRMYPRNTPFPILLDFESPKSKICSRGYISGAKSCLGIYRTILNNC